jgi:hypothetical protein
VREADGRRQRFHVPGHGWAGRSEKYMPSRRGRLRGKRTGEDNAGKGGQVTSARAGPGGMKRGYSRQHEGH